MSRHPGTDKRRFTVLVSQCRNEPESVTVYHGTLQYHHDAELLRTRNIRFRKG